MAVMDFLCKMSTFHATKDVRAAYCGNKISYWLLFLAFISRLLGVVMYNKLFVDIQFCVIKNQTCRNKQFIKYPFSSYH